MASMNENDENRNVVVHYHPEEEYSPRVDLSRPVIKYESRRQDTTLITVQSIKKKCSSVGKDCWRLETLWSFFPVITWLKQYEWKNYLVADILAGFTVGIMSIPQGMAYARLAGMPPVYGLYSNIVPTFVYFFLGTAKIAAIGPVTVLSLITGDIRYKHMPCQDCWMHGVNSSNGSTSMSEHDLLTPIDIGTAVAFLVGVYLIIMGLLRLSFISNYLPDQLVGGFTIAAAVQVFAGQLSPMFGIRLPNRHGIGKVVLNFIDLFSLIAHTNVATFITFLIFFVFLFFCKHLISPRLQPKMKVPFPGEFIVMVAATLVSHFGGLGPRYSVSTVQHIDAGFPSPQIPKLSLLHSLALDTLLLAIITYSHSISLAKLYAKKNGYRVQSTQEFYAYGFTHVIGSFFQCFNVGQSVARSLVYEVAGGKSQLCGLFGTVVVIFTVLFIAPLLEALPDAALAAIIVSACTEMFRTLRELPGLYRKSKYDAAIYVVTLVSVILLDVKYGLAVSVSFALITVVIRSEKGTVEPFNEEARLLFTSESLDLDLDQRVRLNNMYHKAAWNDIVFLRVTTPWFYANAEEVKNALLEKSAADGAKDDVQKNGMEWKRRMEKNGITKDPSVVPSTTYPDIELKKWKQPSRRPAIIVLDLSAVTFTDLMGINAMKEVATKLQERGSDLYVCGYTETVKQLVSSIDPTPTIFPSVLDASSYARFRLHCTDLFVEREGWMMDE